MIQLVQGRDSTAPDPAAALTEAAPGTPHTVAGDYDERDELSLVPVFKETVHPPQTTEETFAVVDRGGPSGSIPEERTEHGVESVFTGRVAPLALQVLPMPMPAMPVRELSALSASRASVNVTFEGAASIPSGSVETKAQLQKEAVVKKVLPGPVAALPVAVRVSPVVPERPAPVPAAEPTLLLQSSVSVSRVPPIVDNLLEKDLGGESRLLLSADTNRAPAGGNGIDTWRLPFVWWSPIAGLALLALFGLLLRKPQPALLRKKLADREK